MKLTIQTTRTITTDELHLFCEPPLTFRVKGFIDPALAKELAQWENTYSGERAAELISQLFVSFSHAGDSYPLDNKSAVLAFKDAIEEGNPGGGEGFLSTLLESYLNEHYRFFRQKLLALENSSQASNNGKVKEATA
jgi:hypothetical protein